MFFFVSMFQLLHPRLFCFVINIADTCKYRYMIRTKHVLFAQWTIMSNVQSFICEFLFVSVEILKCKICIYQITGSNRQWRAVRSKESQIQIGLKAKLWLIIRANKKKLNRVMLNEDDNENGFKTNRSNQPKNKLHVQHTFSSNQQKTNLHVQHAFLFFPCRCFARLQHCFV